MKYFSAGRWIVIFSSIWIITSCNNKTSKKQFEVTGTLTNSNARMVYLEEIPMATMQRIEVDSASISKDGKYSLKTDQSEESIFDLRLDENNFPLTSVINDNQKITLDASFTSDSNHFMEKYEVKGSPASQQLKEFIYAFTDQVKAIYVTGRIIDSLQNVHASDTMINLQIIHQAKNIEEIKNYTLQEIGESKNPSLTMFELGYYQTTANNPSFKIEALSNEEVSGIVDTLFAKFPLHQGLAAVKNSMDAQMHKSTGWVGKEAPEIVLPDINGNEVKLSSFRGKYVLVDFWASWCNPCRHENPNVVIAYNKFKDKNFAILGVSLDKPGEKDQWIKAVKNDKLAWTQVSDLKYWDSKVVPLYNIDGIPYNVLINPEGKIIAEGLRGDALEAKLQEVLK